METNPTVSVIVPTYNCAQYLPATLDSVLAQTYRPIEVIVVDDGSTDNSAEIVGTYPTVRYLYQSNQGAAIARNVGIAAAKGELIAFLDADDIWYVDKLHLQVIYLNQHPQIGILATKVYQFFDSEIKLPSGFRSDKLLGEQPGMLPTTLMIRKTVFEKIGGFSSEFVPSEDTEWLCRARDRQVESAMLPEVLAARRLHESGISWQTSSTSSSRLLKILRASLDRKAQ